MTGTEGGDGGSFLLPSGFLIRVLKKKNSIVAKMDKIMELDKEISCNMIEFL